MKKLLPILFIAFLAIEPIQAQAPNGFNYQAVVRDNAGDPIVNQNVSLRISILEGSASGSSVYSETHVATSNDFGLVNLVIGNGTVVSGNFSTISWGSDSYFSRIELDPAGGSSYSLIGVQQLLSVPYSLYAENTGQQLYSAYGTGALSITGTGQPFAIIPGLELTIDVPENSKILITTDGGYLNNSSQANNWQRFDIQLFVDGVGVGDLGVQRITALNTAAQISDYWSLHTILELTSGTHTIDLRAQRQGGNTNHAVGLSGGAGSVFRGKLIAHIIK